MCCSDTGDGRSEPRMVESVNEVGTLMSVEAREKVCGPDGGDGDGGDGRDGSGHNELIWRFAASTFLENDMLQACRTRGVFRVRKQKRGIVI